MKTEKLIFALAFLFFTLGIQAQSKMYEKLSNKEGILLFDKFSSNKDITSVFVSKSMLSMISDIKLSEMGVNKIIGKLDQNVNFYGVKDKDIIKDLVMFVDQSNSNCTIIRILGTFTTEDIQQISKEAK